MKHPSTHRRSTRAATSTGRQRPAGESGRTIECGTCVAAATTACTDCIVNHLIANDDGPIEFVPVPVLDAPPRSAAARAVDHAVELFRRAGLVDDPVEFVDPAEFEHGHPVTVRA